MRDQAIANSDNATWLTALNSATNANRPDVVFGLLPSWTAQDLSTERGVAKYRMTATPTTTVIMYPSVEAEKIDTPLDLREVSTQDCVDSPNQATDATLYIEIAITDRIKDNRQQRYIWDF